MHAGCDKGTIIGTLLSFENISGRGLLIQMKSVMSSMNFRIKFHVQRIKHFNSSHIKLLSDVLWFCVSV